MAETVQVRVGRRSAGNVEQPPSQEQEADGFLPTSPMAARLHVTPPTLIKWGRDGKLPFIQLERKILWHVPSVEQALLRLQRINGSAAL